MKIVILCGGKGTRLSEETTKIPKPMVIIGNKPILIHIMNFYKFYGFNDFILAAGYKQNIIRNYFKKNKFPKIPFLKDPNIPLLKDPSIRLYDGVAFVS